jgi:hypothetical protein
MNADPDFHPLAAAWLNGSATPPEQSLLGEILHGPDMMREYAALCRTEALLIQRSSTSAQRTSELARMLPGKSWSHRVLSMTRHRTVRWSSAAALIALGAWWLWPNTVEETAGKQKLRIPQRIAGSAHFDTTGTSPANETALPPAAEGLERDLRRCYVAAFSASGPLPDAVAQLAASVKLGQNPPLAADVRNDGDAPVHLQLGSALPAWTVLQMMALQTGTEFKLSGRRLVFLPAARPVAVSGSLTKTASYASLRLFLGLSKAADPADAPEDSETLDKEEDEEEDPADSFPDPPWENPSDMPAILAALTTAALGSPLSFTVPEKSAVEYTGGPRAARVMEMALSVPARPAMEVECNLLILAAPKDVFTDAVREVTSDPDVESFRLTLTEEQHQLVVRKLSMARGVDLMTMPTARGPANEPMKASVEGKVHEHTGVFAKFSGLAGPENALTLFYSIRIGEWDERKQSVLSVEDVGTVSTTSGMTIVVPGQEYRDGKELTYLITGTVLKNNGIPPEGAPEPPVPWELPDGIASEITPEVPPVPPVLQELPYGIPFVDKPGMVQSPYAPEKGFIDVEGYRRGTRVECPYTGKHFRVP